MLKTLRRARTKTNPVFYADRLRSLLASDPDRLQAILEDERSVDLLTWNVFESMDSDGDRDYLASLLQPLAGSTLRAPLRLPLWTGRMREPQLRPSPAYIRHIRERVDDDSADLQQYTSPIEVPVRIESPDQIVLVDTTLDTVPQGAGGRDRIVELVDAGLDQARNVGKSLVIGFVYQSGTQAASTLSARLDALRRHDRLAEALPWRPQPPEVDVRELSWQELLRLWERERDHFVLSGQPVRAFLEHAERLGLR